jgi:hypothetical protein
LEGTLKDPDHRQRSMVSHHTLILSAASTTRVKRSFCEIESVVSVKSARYCWYGTEDVTLVGLVGERRFREEGLLGTDFSGDGGGKMIAGSERLSNTCSAIANMVLRAVIDKQHTMRMSLQDK